MCGKGEFEFGEKRLVRALKRHRAKDAQGLVAAVVAEVQRFSPNEQHDDITVVVAKCRAAE